MDISVKRSAGIIVILMMCSLKANAEVTYNYQDDYYIAEYEIDADLDFYNPAEYWGEPTYLDNSEEYAPIKNFDDVAAVDLYTNMFAFKGNEQEASEYLNEPDFASNAVQNLNDIPDVIGSNTLAHISRVETNFMSIPDKVQGVKSKVVGSYYDIHYASWDKRIEVDFPEDYFGFGAELEIDLNQWWPEIQVIRKVLMTGIYLIGFFTAIKIVRSGIA